MILAEFLKPFKSNNTGHYFNFPVGTVFIDGTDKSYRGRLREYDSIPWTLNDIESASYIGENLVITTAVACTIWISRSCSHFSDEEFNEILNPNCQGVLW